MRLFLYFLKINTIPCTLLSLHPMWSYSIILIYKHNEYYAKTLQQNTTKFCTYSYIIFFNKLYFSVATSHKILFLCSCKSGLSCTKDSFLKCDWLKLSFVLD